MSRTLPVIKPLDPSTAGRFAKLALDCLHREYPNKVSHVLNSDADVIPPRVLTPAFYGCYDWHSAVHGHWLLVRLARLFPEEDFAVEARLAVTESLTNQNIQAEVRYIQEEGRASFERPYGLAWLLQLATELREWDDVDANEWQANLMPLETLAAQRIKEWVPNLNYPIRTGEHSQTAFAFGLVLDWARIVGDKEMGLMLEAWVDESYGGDRDCPIDYEPSGQDFLSPCLAEADLIRRVLGPEKFSGWLHTFLPGIPNDYEGKAWLDPALVTDPSDGKLAHLDGLNLSRAWMLEGIASGLPEGDPRRLSIMMTAARHREVGLASVTGEHYAGGHWLSSFATYLATQRGLS